MSISEPIIIQEIVQASPLPVPSTDYLEKFSTDFQLMINAAETVEELDSLIQGIHQPQQVYVVYSNTTLCCVFMISFFVSVLFFIGCVSSKKRVHVNTQTELETKV
jgi:hypothetical protein